MNDADLGRVQADLDVVKRLCVEPAVPREEVVWLLAVAALGVGLAVAPWLMPMAWVKAGVVLYASVLAAAYLPRKMRLLKQRSPERAMEAKEYWIGGVTAAAVISYVLYSRLVIPRWAPLDAQSWQRDAGTVFIFLGIGLVAGALVHRTRRPILAIALCMMAAGVLMPFAGSIAIGYVIMGTALALGCVGTAIGYEYLARAQRREHDGH